MKTNLVSVFLMIGLVGFGPVWANASEKQQAMIVEPRVYFYALGTGSWYYPSTWDFDLHDGRTTQVYSLLAGAGYSCVNFWDRGFVNLEVDFTGGQYDTPAITDRQISTLSFNALVDWRLDNQNRFSVYCGMGMGFHFHSEYDYLDADEIRWQVYSDLQISVSLIGGIKFQMLPHLFFRSGLRIYLQGTYDDPYYDEGEIRLLGVGMGLEYLL